MAKYIKAVSVWNKDIDVSTLQRGQWVYSDENKSESKGVFCGVKPSGSVVIAWYMNAKSKQSYKKYVNSLMTYAKGI